MASYTTNLNLKKPAGSENVAIGDINNNMDTIDQAYGTLSSKIASMGAPIDVRSQLTTSKCTLNSAGISLINKMVTYFIDFSTTSEVSNGDEIITGMKEPIGTFNNVQYVTAISPSNVSDLKHFAVRDGGKLMALESISASARYRCTFTYFTD